jgi:cobalt-zinc-cadmium efflux system outer membrane protein
LGALGALGLPTVAVFAAKVGAIFVLLAADMYAQAPRKPTIEQYLDSEKGISLGEAVAGALEREPELRAARTEIEMARGVRLQAGLRPNPMIMFEQREQVGGEDNQTMAGIEWPLDLFRRGPRVSVADRETEAVEQAVADRVRILVADVRLKYGEAAAAIRALAIADELAMSAERDLDVRRSRVAEGASPPLERDMLDVEHRRLESDRLIAQGVAEAAMVELKRLLGLSAATPVRLRDTIDTLLGQESIALSTAAITERPDVRQADIRVRLADARIARARSEGRFDMSLFGSYMRMATVFSQQGLNTAGVLEPVHGTFRFLVGGANITLPIRNRNQGEIAAARAERAGAEARLEAARLAADAEIAAAAAQDARVHQALKIIESAVQLSRQNLDIVRQTFELGRATISEVLAEQRRYLELQSTYNATLRSAFEARVMLLRARGDLP